MVTAATSATATFAAATWPSAKATATYKIQYTAAISTKGNMAQCANVFAGRSYRLQHSIKTITANWFPRLFRHARQHTRFFLAFWPGHFKLVNTRPMNGTCLSRSPKVVISRNRGTMLTRKIWHFFVSKPLGLPADWKLFVGHKQKWPKPKRSLSSHLAITYRYRHRPRCYRSQSSSIWRAQLKVRFSKCMAFGKR